ncbi:hypothetical protein Egran_02409 [Elaphomyces granulatus]|uniref:Uncharacterized protein n=1 Tax=Elaphomyces granulatus TaxID=519963 RepID=A0A232M0K3_9EURO|nr:hypothetical protein Egran_02409 [Elaphomyces granulatus]
MSPSGRLNRSTPFASSRTASRNSDKLPLAPSSHTRSAVIAILAIISQHLFDRRGDLTLVVSTVTGCALTWMAAIGYLTSGYIERAEQTGTWAWLHRGRGRAAAVVAVPQQRGHHRAGIRITPMKRATTITATIIGALVLRSPPVSSSSTLRVSASMSQGSSANDSNKKATIRAWTVRMRFRKKGIETGLLEAAVSQCRLRGWPGPVFAKQHANSARLVPRWFHASFEKREKRARASLEVMVASETGVLGTER